MKNYIILITIFLLSELGFSQPPITDSLKIRGKSNGALKPSIDTQLNGKIKRTSNLSIDVDTKSYINNASSCNKIQNGSEPSGTNKVDISIFNGITAFATLGTLLATISLAFIISFKKELRRKQLDTVFELTGQLQNLVLYFSYLIETADKKGERVFSGDDWLYFFELTKAKLKEKEEFNTNANPKIYISEKFLYENSIFKFVYNPFLPKDIALKLINLYPRGGKDSKYDLNLNEIYISDDRKYDTHNYRIEISQYYMTLDKFFNATEDLQMTIRKWLKRYGVTGLNLIDKPINNENYP